MAVAFKVSRTRIAPAAAELESSYGAAATIDGATDGFNTVNSEIMFNADFQVTEFRNHGASFTRGKDVVGQRVTTFNFSTQLQGSGVAGTAVQGINDCLTACGLTEALGAGTVTYAPSTIAALSSATIVTDHNGLKAQAAGCYGNVVLRARAGEPTFATFACQGIYAQPTLATITSWAVGTTGAQRAVPNLGITATIANGTDTWITPTILSYELDGGADIRRIPDMLAATGLKSLLFADRNPRMTISQVLDTDNGTPLIQADEMYLNLTAGTTHAITLVLGTVAGNINTLSVPTAQLVNVQQGAGDGFRTMDATYKVQHATPETEWSLVQT